MCKAPEFDVHCVKVGLQLADAADETVPPAPFGCDSQRLVCEHELWGHWAL